MVSEPRIGLSSLEIPKTKVEMRSWKKMKLAMEVEGAAEVVLELEEPLERGEGGALHRVGTTIQGD